MRRLLPVLLVLLSVVAAGCTDGDKGSSATGDRTSTSGTAPSSSTTAVDDHDHDPGSTTTAFAPTSATGTMSFRMRDFAYVDVPATITGPRVVFQPTNDGPSAHEVQVTDEQGTSMGTIAPIAKGQQATMALELEPGTYMMECFIEAGGKTHAELGMQSTFVVES